jgi:hypothetical protein
MEIYPTLKVILLKVTSLKSAGTFKKNMKTRIYQIPIKLIIYGSETFCFRLVKID